MFHSQFDLGSLDERERRAWRTALRLAAEKGGRVWIAENGEVVASLALTEHLAQSAVDHVSGDKASDQDQGL